MVSAIWSWRHCRELRKISNGSRNLNTYPMIGIALKTVVGSQRSPIMRQSDTREPSTRTILILRIRLPIVCPYRWSKITFHTQRHRQPIISTAAIATNGATGLCGSPARSAWRILNNWGIMIAEATPTLPKRINPSKIFAPSRVPRSASTNVDTSESITGAAGGWYGLNSFMINTRDWCEF